MKSKRMAEKLYKLYRQWVDEGRPRGGEQDGERETAQEPAENLQAG